MDIINATTKYSIIIINYNLTEEVNNCLNSIFTCLVNVNFEVIVVDNNSTDRKITELPVKFPPDKFPNIKFFFLDQNNGFGAGNNYGALMASGEILFFLNPDTVLVENIFPPIDKIFNEDRQCAVVGPKIINGSNVQERSVGLYHVLLLEFLDLFLLRRWVEKLLLKKILRSNSEKGSSVDWVTGAALFIRKSVFEQIGGFDEIFFLYNEEVDLCKRVSALGFTIMFYPNLQVCHYGSLSSKKNYYNFTIVSYESKMLYLNKYSSKTGKIFIRLIMILQCCVQLIIWSLLYPLHKEKSGQKIRGFLSLIHKWGFSLK